MLKEWDELPKYMRTKAVRPYYEILEHRAVSLIIKRIFDVVASMILLLVLSPVMLAISLAIVTDSKGKVLFCQKRITQYGKIFRILKFRTMIDHAETLGSKVTLKNDIRITRVGVFLRKYRLDELPQLINILFGDMTFVGARPEVAYYVKKYSKEMMATLLLPAGVTSEASIHYKDEDIFLKETEDVDDLYLNYVLPGKMQYNLASLRKFNFLSDIRTMIKTIWIVIR